VGLPELRTATPADFDGPGDAWSPEHLLLTAVESRFLFTLRAVARASKLEFVSLNLESEGTVDRERALRVIEKSEKACLVSASPSTPVRLEPDIVFVDTGAAA